MTTTATTADMPGTGFDVTNFERIYVGGAYQELDVGYQNVEVHLMMPEALDDDSKVGLEAEFQLWIPSESAPDKGTFLFNWATFPYEEEYEECDESTGECTWTTETTNYSLACVNTAETGDMARVMNFEGPGDLLWET